MKILIVKMSSMGDVIHALPALVDAARAIPDIHFDWVLEEAFVDIPKIHPLVHRVIPVALRRWRQRPGGLFNQGGFREFLKALRQERYDLVIDSQGLIKSAVTGLLASGRLAGFDRASVRESPAALCYKQSLAVPTRLHAVERQRLLFAGLLGYDVEGIADYGLTSVNRSNEEKRQIMLLHGTTWESKLWPVEYWQMLCSLIVELGYQVVIPSGSPEEETRAKVIAQKTDAEVLPAMSLGELIGLMASCAGVISVDTGLGHMAVALGLPLVSIYGATDPALTGVYGERQKTIVSDHLSCIPCRNRYCRYAIEDYSSKIFPPCYENIKPEAVWQALASQIRH